MDGIEFGREVARQRAEREAQAKLGVLRRDHPEATPGATAADCAAAARGPSPRFDALRRRQVSAPMRPPPEPKRGPFAAGR